MFLVVNPFSKIDMQISRGPYPKHLKLGLHLFGALTPK